MTPWRSRPYLDLSYVEGKTCVRCGCSGCEPCHYSGLYSDQLGKGGAQKSFDAAAADLCRKCHIYFDLYEGDNDDARAAEFLLCILKTLHRNLQQGHAQIAVSTVLDTRREGLPEKEGVNARPSRSLPPSRRRKKRRATTAAANQVKRPAGGFAR